MASVHDRTVQKEVRHARGYGSGIITGVALGLGAALLSPVLARWGRPALKTAAKGGLVAYAAARERVAEMTETISDVLAEAQFELSTEQGAEHAQAQGNHGAGAADAES